MVREETYPRSARERLAMVRSRRSAIIPDHDIAIVRPEYDPGEFASRTILITGVSHFDGFGYATARQLTKMGAGAVAISFRQETDEVQALIADLRDRGTDTNTEIIPIQSDIAQVGQARNLVTQVVEETGRLDVYVDNAGKIAMGQLTDQTPEDVLADTMANIIGPQIILGEAVKQMKTQKQGRIVSVISVAADGVPGQSRYAGAKAYKYATIRSAAMEMTIRTPAVTFVSVAPGLSPTAMTRVVEQQSRPALMGLIGQDRELRPEEVAEYIVYAASSHLPYTLNGQVIPVLRPMAAAS